MLSDGVNFSTRICKIFAQSFFVNLFFKQFFVHCLFVKILCKILPTCILLFNYFLISIKFIFHFLPLFLHDLQDLSLTFLVSYIFTILPTCLVFSVYWTIKKKTDRMSFVYDLSKTLPHPRFRYLRNSSYPRSTNFYYPQNFFYASCH